VQDPARYSERLWPGPLGWSFVAGFALFAGIAVLPVNTVGAAVAAGVSALAGGLVVIVSTTTVAVRDGELWVGRAHIPVGLLGDGEVLDRAGVRAAVGPGSDARAFVCLRAWLRGAVVFPVSDPDDPTPTWLVSSRRPDALAAAVRSARPGPGQDQAAHSEQTI
jgi:hypothetical protein